MLMWNKLRFWDPLLVNTKLFIFFRLGIFLDLCKTCKIVFHWLRICPVAAANEVGLLLKNHLFEFFKVLWLHFLFSQSFYRLQ